MGLFDVFANVMTGGAYGITKATTEATVGGIEQIAGAAAGQTPSGSTKPPYGSSGPSAPVSVQCQNDCCTYSIVGDYLLDCKNGDVWLIEKGKMLLLPIKRQHSKLDSAAGALNLALIREQMMQKKAAQFENLHHSVRVDIEKRFDSMIKILDTEINELHK